MLLRILVKVIFLVFFHIFIEQDYDHDLDPEDRIKRLNDMISIDKCYSLRTNTNDRFSTSFMNKAENNQYSRSLQDDGLKDQILDKISIVEQALSNLCNKSY